MTEKDRLVAMERLPSRATATLACANRLSIFLPERTPSWRLLHEIAHAMSTTGDGRLDGHGPVFVGLYVRLLFRYRRLDPGCLCCEACGTVSRRTMSCIMAR